MATQAPPPFSAFLAPRYWLTWIGIAGLCVLAWLPRPLRRASGTLLGWLTWRFARERRYITEVNIALCFPELDAQAQAKLVRDSFIENGRGVVETGTGWVRPPSHFINQLEFINHAAYADARAQDKGVLILGAHYSTLDFGGNLMAAANPFGVTYRAHKNPLFDAFMLRGRLRNCNGVFDRKNIRGAFRHLREGKTLWYAPDQDYGPEQSVFVPFFGQEAATVTAGTRFAAFNGSPTVLGRQERDHATGKYLIEFIALPGFPSGDDIHDATRINQILEQAIRKAPAQYLWMHKRFKTQRGGKPDSPYIWIKTPNKRLDDKQYEALRETAQPLLNGSNPTPFLRLDSGLLLLETPGLAQGVFRNRHPALRLDQLCKALRAQGIATLTMDNLFRVPSRQLTAMLCFPPPGRPLMAATPDPATAATFLAHLHNAGFHFSAVVPADLLWHDTGPALLHPGHIVQVPGSAAFRQRQADISAWNTLLGADAGSQLLAHYLPQVRIHERTSFAAWLNGIGVQRA